jgi:phosphoglycolate phosphatase
MLLLFDIDGTLMLSHGGGIRAMTAAACRVFSPTFSMETIDCHGRLDPDIVLEALAFNGIQGHTAEEVRIFREHYAALLPHELRSARPLPGVLELLEQLRRRAGVVLGLVTGNYPESGRLKLESVGIDPEWFVVHGFTDVADTRPGLVRWAMEDAAARYGHPRDGQQTIVLGDTPRDVLCAKANGCRCVAVATGKYSVEDLQATAADLVLPDFTDPEPLFQLLA